MSSTESEKEHELTPCDPKDEPVFSISLQKQFSTVQLVQLKIIFPILSSSYTFLLSLWENWDKQIPAKNICKLYIQST